MKNSIKRAQSQARLSFAERENFRPKVRQIKKTILTLVALLAAATGAWAESKPIGLNVEYEAGDVITTNSTGDVYVWWGIYSGEDIQEWVIKITSSVTPTISELGIVESSGFIKLDNDYVVYDMNGNLKAYSYKIQCQGKVTGTLEKVHVASGSGTLTDPYVFAPGSAPAASTGTTVPITWDAATKTGTFTMPAGNVLLQVEYYEDPGLAWKGKIPEGGFDAYLGFFHPSALPTIKNPNALTGITYSSSNTEVATVDENTGVVTAQKTGSTVITATFAGDDTYEAAAISYTLNINSPAIITLPTSTDEGGTVTLVAGAGNSAQDGDNKIATDANLQGANTSRNIAVGDDGSIHVVYKNNNNMSEVVMYKKSTDGVTFSEPVQVSAESGDECEVAVSSNGKVYVSYTTGSVGYIAYSADGSSFTSVQVCSGYANSIHLAVDGDYVYGIPQNGFEFYYSADGGRNYETHTGWIGYAYSDVLIDKSNNNVVVIKDNPSVVVRYSTDHGATFTEEQPVMNGANQLAVFFSTAAAGAGKVFISGTDGTIATVNYINATCTLTTIESTENRSLCADEDENVIVGVEQNGSLYYELSTEGAQTFGEKVLVSEGSSANAALNHHDGSLLYLFTKGTDLYLATKTGVVSTETVIDNGDGTYTVMPGTEVTLIAKANDGYHVKSWSNEAEVNNVLKATQTLTVTGNLNINATFAENEYNITFVEGTNPDPENPEWTATPNPAKTKQTVTVTYSGPRKVMGVKAEKKKAAGIVNPEVGQIIGSDGNNYDANATLPDGVDKVAMIAYVSGSNGLALALTDIWGIYTWDKTGSFNGGKTAPEICSALNTSKPVTGGTWKLPSKDEWKQMFSANGGIEESYTGLNTAIGNAGGTALLENEPYWSLSEIDEGYAWLVNLADGNASWNDEGKHYSRQVRACLAF